MDKSCVFTDLTYAGDSTADWHSLLQAGWQGCTPDHSASFWPPWHQCLRQRESWGGKVSHSRRSLAWETWQTCAFQALSLVNLLSQAVHFSSYSLIILFVVNATTNKNAKSQPIHNEKNSLKSLSVQGAVTRPFQPKLELLEPHEGVCWWHYHVNRIYEPFSMQELMNTC